MIDIRIGDCRQLIHELENESINCVMTSPPYWGLRDYKTEPIIFEGLQDCEHEWINHHQPPKFGKNLPDNMPSVGSNKSLQETCLVNGGYDSNFCSKCGAWRGQLGLEPTPELYIKHMLGFFDDVKLKLKAEGNCFVNLGDTYWGGKGKSGYELPHETELRRAKGETIQNFYNVPGTRDMRPNDGKHDVIKPKSLCMIPQRFAWGMIERGWILRNEIIWAKPNHMPESVTDRLTKAHEVIYHFVKQQKYYYNLDAIREKPLTKNTIRNKGVDDHKGGYPHGVRFSDGWRNSNNEKGKNPGDIWSITTQPYPESHFAVFPLELVRRPILAGCPIGGTVLDPFGGSGTVGEFCRHNERNAIMFELNPEYGKLIKRRSMANIPELGEYI